jgi:hypothetical protein
LPNAGDDLQAIKKGIVEIADLVVINKADIDKQAPPWRVPSGVRCMLRPASPNWSPPVMLSALHKEGIVEFWEQVEKYRAALKPTGEFDAKRQHQALSWMWQLIDSGLRQHFRHHPRVQEICPPLPAPSRRAYDPGCRAYALLDYLKHWFQVKSNLRGSFYARHHPPAGKSVNGPPRRWPEAYRQPAQEGQADGPRTHRTAARSGFLRRMGHVQGAPLRRFRHGPGRKDPG